MSDKHVFHVMRTDSGVSKYRTGYCLVKIHFPVDFKGVEAVNCHQCRLFQRQSGKCPLTGEISEYPDRYVGSCCPLEMEESNV